MLCPGLSCIKVKNAPQRTKGRTERHKKSPRKFQILANKKVGELHKLLNSVSKKNCCGKMSSTSKNGKK